MDYLFTTQKINTKVNDLELFMFGDIHRDTKSCDVDRFRKYIAESKKFNQDKCLYLGLGDYIDFASASEKKKLLSAGLHETTIDKFDRIAMRDIKGLAAEMDHMKGHMIGVIGGNHAWNFANGKNSDEVLAEEMKTKYLGWLSYIRLIIGGTSRRVASFDIVACHGKAGGKLLGSSINQVDDLRKIFPFANLFVMGHDHRLSATPAVILYAEDVSGGIRIKQKEQRLCRSGSFKKTYMVDDGGYEIGKLYTPSILGGLHASIKLARNCSSGVDYIETAIKVHV